MVKAAVAELVYALDSGSSLFSGVEVQILSAASLETQGFQANGSLVFLQLLENLAHMSTLLSMLIVENKFLEFGV